MKKRSIIIIVAFIGVVITLNVIAASLHVDTSSNNLSIREMLQGNYTMADSEVFDCCFAIADNGTTEYGRYCICLDSSGSRWVQYCPGTTGNCNIVHDTGCL